MQRLVKRAATFAAIGVIGVAFTVACGNGDDDGNDITPTGAGTPAAQTPAAQQTPAATPRPGGNAQDQQVQQAVQGAVNAYNQQDIEGFLSYWTEEGLQAEFGVSADMIRANPEMFFGGPPGGIQIGQFRDTDVSDNEATVEFEFVFGQAISTQRYTLISDAGEWRINETEEIDTDIPDGVDEISVSLEDFAFDFDPAEIENGNIAFSFRNAGDQAHEAILISVPEGFTVEDVLAIEGEDLPAGVELIGGAGPFESGQDGNMVFRSALASGSYMFLCFLPDEDDPQGTPHVILGMAETFQIP